jgi:hypothetical protein
MRFIPAAPHQVFPKKRRRIRAKFIVDTVAVRMTQRPSALVKKSAAPHVTSTLTHRVLLRA